MDEQRDAFQLWLSREMGLPQLSPETLKIIFTPQLAPLWTHYSQTIVDPKRYEQFKRIYYKTQDKPSTDMHNNEYPVLLEAEQLVTELASTKLKLPRASPQESVHKNLVLKRSILRATNEFIKLVKSHLNSQRDRMARLRTAMETRKPIPSTTGQLSAMELRQLQPLDLSEEIKRLQQEIIDGHDELESLNRQSDGIGSRTSRTTTEFHTVRAEIRGWETAVDTLKSEMSALIMLKQKLLSPAAVSFLDDGSEMRASFEHLQHSLNRYHWLWQSINGEYDVLSKLTAAIDTRKFIEISGQLSEELGRLRQLQLCRLVETSGVDGALIRMDELPQYKWAANHPSFVEMRSLLRLAPHSSIDQLVPAVEGLLETDGRMEIKCKQLQATLETCQKHSSNNNENIKDEMDRLRDCYSQELRKINQILRKVDELIPELVEKMQFTSQQALNVFNNAELIISSE